MDISRLQISAPLKDINFKVKVVYKAWNGMQIK